MWFIVDKILNNQEIAFYSVENFHLVEDLVVLPEDLNE